MKTIVSKFNAPEVTVRITNLSVDAYNKKFSLTLSTKEKGKRKWNTEDIAGTITKEVAEYFSLLKDEKIKVVADNEVGYVYQTTGRKLTNFQRYLIKRGIQETPGILSAMKFEADNYSEEYPQNPFRIVRYQDGRNTLTLINVSSMVRKAYLDPNSNETTSRYSYRTFVDANGQTRRSFIIPKYYRRLVVQELIEVEQFVEARD